MHQMIGDAILSLGVAYIAHLKRYKFNGFSPANPTLCEMIQCLNGWATFGLIKK
ncbi:hypothetical protein ACRRVB_03985 [Candidatus Cardinium hertigii]|uniref:hypothetical protein n=1 Tax=Candidatus Cardinium hertigii TaxID=247481 RepID=UPI003D7CFC1D